MGISQKMSLEGKCMKEGDETKSENVEEKGRGRTTEKLKGKINAKMEYRQKECMRRTYSQRRYDTALQEGENIISGLGGGGCLMC
jgi:hypothetical protein